MSRPITSLTSQGMLSLTSQGMLSGVQHNAPLIELADVEKIHQTRARTIQAISGVNVRIEPGEFVSLLGPSGCGKSTLLNLIAGLDRPTAGTVRFDGKPRTAPDRTVAVNFQEPALFPWRDVRANVSIALESTKKSRAEIARSVDEAIEAVGLTQFASVYPNHLSGGMKQRVMLARSLAINAPVMLLDEPFAALDAITRESMQDLVTRLYSARRFSVVFVTHSIEEALFTSQRIIVMSARPGRVVYETRLEEPYPRSYEWRLSERVASLRRELHQLMSGFENDQSTDND